MMLPRRYRDLTIGATFAWSTAILALALLPSCRSFSVLPNAGPQQQPYSALHAGPFVEERRTDVFERIAIDDRENNEESSLVTLEESQRSSLAELFPQNRQVLEFVEPTTNVTVVLIGAMHYNPASIQLVEKTVDDLGATNKLGSVIIESCDIRWNKTQEVMEKKRKENQEKLGLEADANTEGDDAAGYIESNPNDKDLLGNEMRAAWEIATKYYRPTVLGDQRINITIDALKESLKDTAKDLFLSGPDGWRRTQKEIASNWEKTVPISAGKISVSNGKTDTIAVYNEETRYLNAFAFFDPRLLISLPVSLVKYPLSFLVRDPIPFGTFFAAIAALNIYGGGWNFQDVSLEDWLASAAAARASANYPWTDYVISLLIAVLESVVFARLLLKPLLADRNEILARSILDQCRVYANGGGGNDADTNPGFGSWFQNFFFFPGISANDNSIDEEDSAAPVYVPGSDPASMTLASQRAKSNSVGGIGSNNGKVVVAVLGMAHCNGIMKLLKEQNV
mmetsp:Transcript_5741/g.14347  ORF Transcript_5741/g.14347 Transcript_5741/m.14347 type:complete len:510 (+) Transcript_5741:297-1826(+)|eukprot:CAMPEP_0197181478 /NCGR_PEP_ID=MMETSP1423-20130617/5748_1 /TAXON_ID=476441 /ORGANISM="Pseudo-nitzschia heimii, Strain UNC1101" /LENGTH=509 /DNA_ID=CAMNT_0042631733 /DNA_START=277 /DNA_END=1806 /DNA_ORIENTATION=-